MDNLILADFKTKTWHKPESLEHLANVIFDQVFPCEMPPVQPVYHAPPEDCA